MLEWHKQVRSSHLPETHKTRLINQVGKQVVFPHVTNEIVSSVENGACFAFFQECACIAQNTICGIHTGTKKWLLIALLPQGFDNNEFLEI